VNQGNTFRVDLDLRDSLDRRLHPEALVLQEDRNLIMGSQSVIDLDAEHEMDAAYLAMVSHEQQALGRYLLLRERDGRPYWTYLAVVHDFDTEPTCRPSDVRRCLRAILKDALNRRIRSLAAEPLGAWRQQGLSFESMVEAFDSAIVEFSAQLDTPLRLTLLLDEDSQLEEVSHLLRSCVLRKASRSFRTVDGGSAVVEVRQGGARLHYRFVPGSLSGYIVTRVGSVA